MGPETLKVVRADSAGEALEDLAVLELGGLGQSANGVVERGRRGALLELDNVLVGKELGAPRLQERGGLSALCGGGEGQGEQREEERGVHIGQRKRRFGKLLRAVDLSGCSEVTELGACGMMEEFKLWKRRRSRSYLSSSLRRFDRSEEYQRDPRVGDYYTRS